MLDELLEAARRGRSGALVVRGEPGVGKAALLEYAIDAGSDLRVVRALGVESEMELAFAALHQLCAPILDRRDRLPGPQRDALATTFGFSAGPVPDRFLVGMAVLGLLAESVLVVFAAREPGEELRGLPELVVEGLPKSDAQELLRSVIPGPFDDAVREQLVVETRGNPLALLDWGSWSPGRCRRSARSPNYRSRVSWWDTLVHATLPAVLAPTALLLLIRVGLLPETPRDRGYRSVVRTVLLVFLIAAGFGTVYELYKWFADAQLGAHYQPDNSDTMTDTVATDLGGLAGGLWLAACARGVAPASSSGRRTGLAVRQHARVAA